MSHVDYVLFFTVRELRTTEAPGHFVGIAARILDIALSVPTNSVVVGDAVQEAVNAAQYAFDLAQQYGIKPEINAQHAAEVVDAFDTIIKDNLFAQNPDLVRVLRDMMTQFM